MEKTKSELLRRFERRFSYDNFFTGKLYPLVVVALVFVGLFTGYEVFTNLALSILTFIALLTSKTIRPLLPYLFNALYQIPKDHLISDPTSGEDFLFSGWRLYIVIGSVALVFLGVVIFLIRSGIRHRAEKKEGLYRWSPLPLFVPVVLFCLSFYFNGYGTDGALGASGYVYTFGQTVVYGLLFFALFRGLSEEDSDEFLAYFAYLTLLSACILNTQVILYHYDKYLETGTLEFVRNGKEITLGFGDCNLVAFNVGSLIPMQIYGFVKCRGRLVYLFGALLSYVCTVSCVSRSSLVFGTAVLLLGFLFAFFARDLSKARRVTNRILLVTVTACIVAVVALFPAQVKMLYQDFFDRMTNEGELETHTELTSQAEQEEEKEEEDDHLKIDINFNSRSNLWKKSYENFKENPLFGKGSGHIEAPDGHILSDNFFPYMAHNTFFQLLGSGGLVAVLAYLIYRLSTLFVLLRRPSTNKLFLLLVCLFLLGTSLVDNYVFYLYTTFHYITALAFACKIDREQTQKRKQTKARVKEILLSKSSSV